MVDITDLARQHVTKVLDKFIDIFKIFIILKLHTSMNNLNVMYVNIEYNDSYIKAA